MPTRSRFAGLKLEEGDRARLKQMETGGARMSVRTWRRVRTLLLLDLGYTVTATAEALGTYRRETARIGKRYLAGGLEHALGDDPRPKPASMLDSTQQAAIVAMVCGPPPVGARPLDGAVGGDGGGQARHRAATGTRDGACGAGGPWQGTTRDSRLPCQADFCRARPRLTARCSGYAAMDSVRVERLQLEALSVGQRDARLGIAPHALIADLETLTVLPRLTERIGDRLQQLVDGE